MPSVTRQRSAARRRREPIEDRVMTTTLRLLEDGESFTALGVGRIADEAGIARSSFYVSFADKNELLVRISHVAADALLAPAEAWVRDGSDPQTLLATMRRIVALRREHQTVLGALDEVAAYEPEIADLWRERIERFADLTARRIAADVDAGRTLPGVDPVLTARWIAWGTERLVATHVTADAGDGDERLAQTLARVVWASVYPPASGTP